MNKIIYGERTFEQRDIKTGNCYLAVSLLSDQLEAGSFEVDVRSTDKTLLEYNQNDPLSYFYDGNQVGVFYVQNIKRTSPDIYHISATDTIGLLEQKQHYGGIYNGETVADAIADICGNIPVIVKSNIKGIQLYGWLPIASARDNLAQVVFAIGAVVKTDRSGNLRIEGLWNGTADVIGSDRVFMGGAVENATKVTRISVTEHQYLEGTESEKLFEGTTEDGDLIKFDEPCHDLVATGFNILRSSANYAVVSSGTGTIYGIKYIHATRDVVKRNVARLVDQYENDVTVTDATLVSLANANAVAERLMDYFQAAQTISQDVVVNAEKPGDVVETYDPYDRVALSACVKSMDINLSKMLRATEKALVGYLPPDIGEQEYFDKTEILTGNGTWTVPEGVTSIRAVLIGGGQGGKCGKKGGDGEAVQANYTEPGQLAIGQTSGYSLGIPGDGGEGGEGGQGGSILQVSINVETGQEFAYSSGQGGSGAEYSTEDAEGTLGTETTFGEYNSDNGSSSDIGYTDILSGAIYGAKGNLGIAGGRGSGGSNRNPQKNDDGCILAPGESVIDEDGIEWACGNTTMSGVYPKGQSARVIPSSDGNLSAGYAYASASVSCGSGAAAGSNGTDGSEEPGSVYASKSKVSGTTNSWNCSASARGLAGINGAAATLIPKKPAAYGQGGRGGYGGGGASGHGWALRRIKNGSAMASLSGSAYGGDLGKGGNGAGGGEGADGCILLYYRQPKGEMPSGMVKGKDGKFIIDKFKRKLVV